MTELPIGPPVPDWRPPPRPGGAVLAGRHARLVPLSAADHAGPLWAAMAGDDAMWTYMAVGPFADAAAFRGWLSEVEPSRDPIFYTIADGDGPGGLAAFLRIAPEAGVIEIGSLVFAQRLRRSRAATEAIALMMGWAFGAGYRRVEWKCDALNAASRRAALRLGFAYEGTFRQAMVVKGRNRDTARFAVVDRDWPDLRAAYEAWLDPSNFDGRGVQRTALSALTGVRAAGRGTGAP